MVSREDKYVWSGEDISFGDKKSIVIHGIKPETKPTPSLFVPSEMEEIKTIHGEAVEELRAWQKFIVNGTATKREFRTYMVRDDIADELREAIKQAEEGQRPAFAYIPLPNNVDVLGVQRTLKEQLPDERIKWELAPTFHITLAFANLMDDKAIEKIASLINLEAMEIQPDRGEEIRYFDTPNGKALHIAIAHTSVLDAIQADVYSAFETEGHDLSEVSEPGNWNPHITLAYVPDDIELKVSELLSNVEWIGDIVIHSDKVVIGRADYDPVLTLTAPAYKRFHTHEISGSEEIASKAVQDAIKHAFWHAEAQSVIKSDDEVRSQFELEIKRLVDTARAGSLSRSAFTQRMKKVIRQYGNAAFLAGLRDGGVIIEDLNASSAEDALVLAGLLNEHTTRAKGLSDLIYKQKLSDAQAKLKPRQWYGKTIRPFYDAGLLSAARNQMVEVVGPIDENSCPSCRKLVGQRHRRKAFAAAGFNPPYGKNIQCSDGGLCKHRLISVNSRPRGNLSSVPRK